jgi:hypothetical protein
MAKVAAAAELLRRLQINNESIGVHSQRYMRAAKQKDIEEMEKARADAHAAIDAYFDLYLEVVEFGNL